MSVSAFSDYLLLERKYSTLTVGAYLNDLTQFSAYILEFYDDEGIDEVNYAMIRSWILCLVDSGLSNRSVNRKIASLKAYYTFLVKIGVLQLHPLAKHRALKTTASLVLPYSEDEMDEVLDFTVFNDDFEGVRDHLIVLLLYSTGIRRAELINLTLGRVSVDGRKLRVIGKRNKERVIPMLDSLVEPIKSYLRIRAEIQPQLTDAFFITKSGGKLYPTLVYRVINSYFSKVTTKARKSPHVLRHTFATHLLNKGVAINSVKELLGHSSLASTQVYTHNDISELKKVHLGSHPRNQGKDE